MVERLIVDQDVGVQFPLSVPPGDQTIAPLGSGAH